MSTYSALPVYGTADQLEALGDGYFGLNQSFMVTAVLLLLTIASAGAGKPILTLAAFGLQLVGSGASAYPACKKLAFGQGKPPTNAALSAIMVSLLSWLCFGVLGYVVLQSTAAREIQRYGAPVRSLGGIKKKDFYAFLADRRAMDAALAASSGFTPGFQTPT